MRERIRLGYLTYGLDRAPTGIGRLAVALLEALAALPDAPEIVLLTTERTDRHGLWDRFERRALPGCSRLPSLMTLGNAALAFAAQRYQLDVIHDPNGIAPFLGARRRSRRVVTVHDAFPYVVPDAHNWLDNWRYRHILPQAACRADMVLTVSQASKQDIQQHLHISERKVRVIYEGTDSAFSPVVDGPERRALLARYGIAPPYLLYVGAINGRKNIARLYEAFARVRQRHPALKLVVVGKRQWQTAAIDATFTRLHLHEAVIFTGYVADRDLPALYSAADAFVFPSLYEGFGLPPLEAMACGAPVVTSNVSSLPEVVGDAALTVDPTDVAALAGALERLLTEPALRAELRRRGLARAAQFSWGRAARQTLAVYHEVLDRRVTAVAPRAGSEEEQDYAR